MSFLVTGLKIVRRKEKWPKGTWKLKSLTMTAIKPRVQICRGSIIGGLDFDLEFWRLFWSNVFVLNVLDTILMVLRMKRHGGALKKHHFSLIYKHSILKINQNKIAFCRKIIKRSYQMNGFWHWFLALGRFLAESYSCLIKCLKLKFYFTLPITIKKLQDPNLLNSNFKVAWKAAAKDL